MKGIEIKPLFTHVQAMNEIKSGYNVIAKRGQKYPITNKLDDGRLVIDCEKPYSMIIGENHPDFVLVEGDK
jgi:hypothetical protein